MNPELPQVRPSHEVMPQIPGSVEYFPDGTAKTPEQSQARPEFQPVPVEQDAAPTQGMPVPTTPIVAQDANAQDASSQTHQLVSGAPVTAADDDLIEKEWVDKVKKIIVLTKGRPYEQAKAIALLQADYLKKRHNRELGGTDGQ